MNAKRIRLLSVVIAFSAACGGLGGPGGSGSLGGGGGACLYTDEDSGAPTSCQNFVGSEYAEAVVRSVCPANWSADCPQDDSVLGICKHSIGTSEEFHTHYYGEWEDEEEHKQLVSSFRAVCEYGEDTAWIE